MSKNLIPLINSILEFYEDSWPQEDIAEFRVFSERTSAAIERIMPIAGELDEVFLNNNMSLSDNWAIAKVAGLLFAGMPMAQQTGKVKQYMNMTAHLMPAFFKMIYYNGYRDGIKASEAVDLSVFFDESDEDIEDE